MKVFRSPGGRPFLVWTLAVQLVLCGSWVSAAESVNSCKLLANSSSEWTVLKRLEPLANKNFTVEDESYRYVFQLCGDAGGVPGAGLIQMDKKETGKKQTVIGMYNATQAIGGSDWVMLIYGNGDTYKDHCNKEKRRAIVMISCDRKKDMGNLEVVLEDRSRGEQCFYLFELDSSAVCPAIESNLSTGSILLIIGFSILGVYLIGGFLYQRLIVGAKGMEQFPNYAFWVEIGNLTADGCDFVCRSRNREESPAYRGVAPETLAEEPEERDDHLLPM
ncbi:cation-dependent mannose-6-phosphate receptor [Seriola lalandi dorsalis]|uniref:Cation-dependent mannose-6-phosphate receptor n=1 Tax=Seriola lalandi dorsalis TaxID=1841481 RepID=A0A3B4YHQ9_SERLL|nr:cation-dependent mannose-6-phosphate receptor [Seriola lalandi dorsalis]XP_056236303.1 cation-dependent mannose-6-phosphate receptor [Seriola aureovittata]